MKKVSQQAFTIIELIFVILIISILSIVAMPRLLANKDQAVIAMAKNTVATIRASISAQKQTNALHQDFSPISILGTSSSIFGGFNGDISSPVLDYGVVNCVYKQTTGCWKKQGDYYIFVLPDANECRFHMRNDRFIMEASINKSCNKIDR